MFRNNFSFKGRIRRTEYFLTYPAVIFLYVFLDVFLQFFHIVLPELIRLILITPILWIFFAQSTKRCHDRGNSGWYQLIPFYQFWMFLADSDHGPNEYGDNPKGIGNHDEIKDIGIQIENE